jgi:hypothetical protein
MVFEKIVQLVTSVLGWVAKVIPGVNLNLGDFGQQLQFLVEKGKAFNAILPIQEAIVFAGIALGIKLALMTFWAAMRVVNLIRGAG